MLRIWQMGNRELYLKAMELIGKETLERKQKDFLVRIIDKAELKAQNLTTDELKKKKALEILADLNLTCMANFRDTDNNLKFIYARLAESFTVDDFKLVHRLKASHWLESDKFRQYLRPSTLYSSKNFESYLNDALSKSYIGTQAIKRNWYDFKTLQELIDNRKGLDIPEDIKQLYAFYSVSRDKKDIETMNKLNELYKIKLEDL